jgi:DNA polymerase III delta prime subunit
MIETKLILIEGPPGSGKSTTAHILAHEIASSGTACQPYLEWSADHPIYIGDDLHLEQVTATSLARQANVVQQWQRFSQTRQTEPTVSIIESRFWQTGVMLLYAAGLSPEGVLESNQQVIKAIRGLNPVLIYFKIEPLSEFTLRMIEDKEAEWRRSGFPGTWVGHVYRAFDGQKWFTERGLSGLAGLLAFLEEWAGVAEKLYENLPFPKIQISNPHQDWRGAMGEMRRFLELEPSRE